MLIAVDGWLGPPHPVSPAQEIEAQPGQLTERMAEKFLAALEAPALTLDGIL